MLPVCKYAILILIISILLLHFRLSSPANIHQRLLQFLRPEGMSILIVLSMYSNHYTQQVYTCKFKCLYITSYSFSSLPLSLSSSLFLFLSLSISLSFCLSPSLSSWCLSTGVYTSLQGKPVRYPFSMWILVWHDCELAWQCMYACTFTLYWIIKALQHTCMCQRR